MQAWLVACPLPPLILSPAFEATSPQCLRGFCLRRREAPQKSRGESRPGPGETVRVVGMTGLDPEERFRIISVLKAAGVVEKWVCS